MVICEMWDAQCLYAFAKLWAVDAIMYPLRPGVCPVVQMSSTNIGIFSFASDEHWMDFDEILGGS